MTEITRVPDAEHAEIVEETPAWEELVSAYSEGAAVEFAGQVRQAQVFASVSRHYGRKSLETFAKEVGCSKTKAYDWARVWWIYGHMLSGDGFSARPDSPLTISHYVEASYAPDPVRAIEEAEDEGLTTRQIEAKRKEPKPAETDGSPNLITHFVCNECGCLNEMSRVETKELPA